LFPDKLYMFNQRYMNGFIVLAPLMVGGLYNKSIQNLFYLSVEHLSCELYDRWRVLNGLYKFVKRQLNYNKEHHIKIIDTITYLDPIE